MNYSISLVTPPIGEPITLAQAKLYLRLEADYNLEDSLLAECITTARVAAENFLLRSIMNQKWRISVTRRQALRRQFRLHLPKGPVQRITNIYAMNPSGLMNLLGGMDYLFLISSSEIDIRKYPYQHEQLVVEYEAGYDASGDVPACIKQAMLMHIAALYEQRGAASVSMPAAARELYQPLQAINF